MAEVPDVLEETPVAAPAPPPLPEGVSLRNRYAVRSALLAGVSAFLLSATMGPFGLLALVAGGAFAVFLYRRSTGARVSVGDGARLGWITGLFLFLLLLVTFTASAALVPTFFADMEKQLLASSTVPKESVQEVIAMLRTPLGIGAMVLGMFLSATVPSAIGGAAGAKLVGRG